MPGTEMKVTPEMDVPTMAMATTGHGDCLPPRKKSALREPLRELMKLMAVMTRKYMAMAPRAVNGMSI